MDWFVWLLMLLYVAALLRGMGLWSVKDPDANTEVPELKASIIVPFRNEQAHLEALVKSLAAQQYQKLEVIFVNDHSTDQSAESLKELIPQIPYPTQLLSLEQAEGKKAAIAHGIANASGDIILTTDADCTMDPNWVKEMLRPFNDERIQMVSGPVALTGKGLFQRWQQMEFASLIATGAASIRAGKPTMANGANLAYRKPAFEAVGGFENISQTPSGDDELLMMKLNEAFPKGVAFRKAVEATVHTAAHKSWSAFKHQRLRWASKWQVGKRPATRLIALFIFLINLLWLVLPLFAWLDWVAPETPIRIYNLRFIIEAIWLMCLARFFPNALSVRCLILHQLLYPLYVIYFGLMANFGNYQWKGRSYAVRVQ